MMIVNYVGEESEYFIKNKQYYAEWDTESYDTPYMYSIGENNVFHVVARTLYDLKWFTENFVIVEDISNGL